MLISSESIASLKEELKDPEGFASYKEVQLWLKADLGVEVNYHVVHRARSLQTKGKTEIVSTT